MGNLSGESREQNRKDKLIRFPSVTYARQLGLLVNTPGSHLKPKNVQTSSRSLFCDKTMAGPGVTKHSRESSHQLTDKTTTRTTSIYSDKHMSKKKNLKNQKFD